MRLDTKPGEFVTFTGENGHPGENLDARMRLKIGEKYEVENMEVRGFSSSVKLFDVGWFNTVMFENFEAPSPVEVVCENPRPQHPVRGIVAVALRLNDLIISMPAPARHHDVAQAMAVAGIEPHAADQGFLDHRGIYLSRATARIVAGQHNQINRAQMEAGGDLFSEDLW